MPAPRLSLINTLAHFLTASLLILLPPSANTFCHSLTLSSYLSLLLLLLAFLTLFSPLLPLLILSVCTLVFSYMYVSTHLLPLFSATIFALVLAQHIWVPAAVLIYLAGMHM